MEKKTGLNPVAGSEIYRSQDYSMIKKKVY
jgi:hypothetical protein